MSTTVSEVVVPSLERMLSEVQTKQADEARWATLTTSTLEIAKSHVRHEEKVDKRFDQVDKRLGLIEDEVRKNTALLERIAVWVTDPEKPKGDSAAE